MCMPWSPEGTEKHREHPWKSFGQGLCERLPGLAFGKLVVWKDVDFNNHPPIKIEHRRPRGFGLDGGYFSWKQDQLVFKFGKPEPQWTIPQPNGITEFLRNLLVILKKPNWDYKQPNYEQVCWLFFFIVSLSMVCPSELHQDTFPFAPLPLACGAAAAMSSSDANDDKSRTWQFSKTKMCLEMMGNWMTLLVGGLVAMNFIFSH